MRVACATLLGLAMLARPASAQVDLQKTQEDYANQVALSVVAVRMHGLRAAPRVPVCVITAAAGERVD